MDSMDDAKRLEQALNRTYAVAVQPTGKGYELFIRELGLRHACTDLTRGHAELLELKDAWIRDLAQEGLWDWITPPGGKPQEERPKTWRWRDLAPFFIKCVCVVLLVLWISARLANALRDVGWGLEKKIGDVIMMPEDKSLEMQKRTRAFAVKLRPFVQELMIVFKPEADANATAAGAANATGPAGESGR
jgi:hypothetical protein